MHTSDHIAALRHEGHLLATAAEAAGPDAEVPTCPEWRVRDLIHHVGGVHRWAAMHLDERRTAPVRGFDEAVPSWPDDAGLIDWFREGHVALIRSLESAGDDLECWSFLPAPSPRAFWARRQAHETSIHRVDAESARGDTMTPFPADFAADGVDELLLGFLGRRNEELRSEAPRSLHLHATDVDGEWLVLIGRDQVEVRREHARGDCAVRATASDLQMLLWNRRTPEGLEVLGDATVLDLWRDKVHVRWSR
jgi:uncharacterized protein (TIGR03083 family)